MSQDRQYGTVRASALRLQLRQIQAKYDGGGMPQAVYNVCQRLERDIAWAEHNAQPQEQACQ